MMVKRAFDLAFAFLGLLLLWPLLLIVAVSIRMDSPGPVLFRQVRVGRFGKLFRIHKFRTMRVDDEGSGPMLTSTGDVRITRVGGFLRKYKLDELPQFIDVIKGDMSLVGPRPEIPKYIDFYPARVKAVILSLPPGITDLASIAFKNENDMLARALNPEREYTERILPLKLELCESYVLQRSLWGDCIIILKTLRSIFGRAANSLP
jgi:lipopolysaccharide/colanic/teichoic acid biosynthesis glycosyltransferase